MASLLIIFVLGLMVGSFLNCVIYRLETKQNFFAGRPRRETSFLRGRSFCPHCKHTLSWGDLLPILSFLFLRGKCRYCRGKISWQYPLVELATGILFALCFLFHLPWIIYIIAPFLIVIFVYDLKHYLIPDKVIYPAIGLAFIYNLLRLNLEAGRFGLDVFWSALGAAAFFGAVVLMSRGKWMGIGDIKLAFLIGLVLGWPQTLVALFLAFFLGAIIGIGLIISGKKKLSSEVPFGPFLVAGTFLALFCGQNIIDWYLNLCTRGLL